MASLVALSMAGAVLALRSAGGLEELWMLHRELQKARTEVARLEHARDALSDEVRALEDDPAEIERRAREDLGMIFPGELVLRCCD